MKIWHFLTPAGSLLQHINFRPQLPARVIAKVLVSLSEHLGDFVTENCMPAGQWEEDLDYSFPQLTVLPNVGGATGHERIDSSHS